MLRLGEKISVYWITAHMGTKRDDMADSKAKRYAENLSTSHATDEVQTLAHACRAI